MKKANKMAVALFCTGALVFLPVGGTTGTPDGGVI